MLDINSTWDVLEVSKDGSKQLNGDPFEVGDRCSIGESTSGLSFENRDTPCVGSHLVAFDDIGKYVYTVRCNTPGEYFLGPNHGYRKKPDSEEVCPVKAALRRNSLPINKLSIGSNTQIVRRSDETAETPRGSRFTYYDTNSTNVVEISRRFNVVTDVIQDFSYLIEISEEARDSGDDVCIFRWLSKVHLSDTISDDDAYVAAMKIEELVKKNKEEKGIYNGD